MNRNVVIMIALLSVVGCERKADSAADTGHAKDVTVDASSPPAEVKAFYYTKHLDADAKPKHRNDAASGQGAWITRHGHQPTNWTLWSAQITTIAKSSGKPIFVFVGDIECTSCVKTSSLFDDAAVATVLNERFIPVIVDAAERPDIAQFIRDSVVASTARTPPVLAAVLTPDGHLAYTLNDLSAAPLAAAELQKLGAEYAANRDKIDATAKEVTGKVRKMQQDAAGKPPQARAVLDTALNQLHQSYDAEHGGWPKDAAKQPMPSAIRFALRASRWAEEKDAALALATGSLDAILASLKDERGFFTSTGDVDWKLTHKVKSLHTNALLLQALTEAWQVTQSERYEEAARSIAAFITQDLKAPDGGFYAHEITRPDGAVELDKRVVAAANGAAIGALARSGWVFDEADWVTAAAAAAKALPTAKGQLVHSRHGKELARTSHASDFAAAIDGLLSLFEASADSAHLRRAVLLQNQLDVIHGDPEEGGYFHVPTAQPQDLPLRVKVTREQGEPTAMAMTALNTLRLEELREDASMTKKRGEVLGAIGALTKAEPLAAPTLLLTLDWLAGDRKRVTVVGNERQAMLEVLRSNFFPHMVYATVGQKTVVPWLAAKEPRAKKATAFVCRAECSAPITEPAEFEKELRAP